MTNPLIPADTDFLQEIISPYVQAMFDNFGQLVNVVLPGEADQSTVRTMDGWGHVNPPAPSDLNTNYDLLPSYSAYGRQVSPKERKEYVDTGLDIALPLWMVLIDISAPVATPGYTLRLFGGALTEPVILKPHNDAEDISSQGIVWRVLCAAVRSVNQ